jgi:hypothetical protein
MPIKLPMAPCGTMQAVLRSTKDDSQWIVILPPCHAGKSNAPPRRLIPKLFFKEGFCFKCPVCKIEYEVVYFRGLNYTLQWTQRQD